MFASAPVNFRNIISLTTERDSKAQSPHASGTQNWAECTCLYGSGRKDKKCHSPKEEDEAIGVTVRNPISRNQDHDSSIANPEPDSQQANAVPTASMNAN